MKNKTHALILGIALAFSIPAIAADLDVKASDSVESVLAAQKGKRVTIKTRSGQEITGTVKMVSPKLVQVSQVSGREFFDAVLPLEAVEAVLVRTKD